MSRSPAAESGDVVPYRDAWRATARLLREGNSFSGRERNCAFLNIPASRFANLSALSGLDFADDGRAQAVCDWDHDGDLDLWLYNRTGPRLRLMLNQVADTKDANRQFLSIRLQGTTSNRDAIGARVVVRAPNQPVRLQTLSAGDAYLSQSSKSLHFGMGDAPTVDGVEVRWPNGQWESFDGVAVNGRYLLVEGTGRAQQVATRRHTELSPGPNEAGKDPRWERIVLASPVPLPILPFEDDASNPQHIHDLEKRYRLVVLWASWCPVCMEELTQLREAWPQLQQSGVDTLALSVDGLDLQHDTGRADASRVADQLAFPFPWGIASEELIRKLSLLHTLLINQPPPLSVPMSFLVDADGSLVALYFGNVTPDTILTDVEASREASVDPRSMAAPYRGIWGTPPRTLMLSAMARTFREEGFEEDYKHYRSLDVERLTRLYSAAANEVEREALARRLADVHYDLAVEQAAAGRMEEADQHYLSAIDVLPGHSKALTNLATLRLRQDARKEAIDLLSRAVRDPAAPIEAHRNLALALSAAGRASEAIPHFRSVIELEPDNRIRPAFARALMVQGDFTAAKEQLEAAVTQRPDDFSATMALAWLLATHPDSAVRDGSRAVELAKKLNSGQTQGDPLPLDVLAAALAEQGDFDAATATLERAMAGIANAKGSQVLDARLQLYRQQQPHRDADGQYP